MKYYDTSFEDYLQSVSTENIHPELSSYIQDRKQISIDAFQNTIIYGPSGSGKYSFALSLIHPYSPSKMKYDKKISVFNEKFEKKSSKDKKDKKKTSVFLTRKVDFLYRLSDVHYEVDMSLLGCNSKSLWNEIFFQIVDIVSVNTQKFGIILCKNVHCIYNELLDVFYSYINHPLQYNGIYIKFILLTEHLSFLPENISQNFRVIHVQRPSLQCYTEILNKQQKNMFGTNSLSCIKESETNTLRENLIEYGKDAIENLKEIHIMKRVKGNEIPTNVFNCVTDDLLHKIYHPDSFTISELRNSLYEMLVYNLDISECLTYIIFNLIQQSNISSDNINQLLINVYTFLKYYNNNYRPIYHLELIIVDIINKVHYE
jgi:hypothetical protein